jgi:DNA-binding response OmpR family regulator
MKSAAIQKRIRIRIVRDTAGSNGHLNLFINGRRIRASQTQAALATCLCERTGRVVSYKRLCQIIGHEAARAQQRHILRQHTQWLKQVLAANGAPYTLAVASGLGYALCELPTV